jgi:hypothetical protein
MRLVLPGSESRAKGHEGFKEHLPRTVMDPGK